MDRQEERAPVRKFHAGNVWAAVWRNDFQENGKAVSRYSVKIEKRYRDAKKNAWRPTNLYFRDDLPALRLVSEKAYEFIALKESDENAARSAPAR